MESVGQINFPKLEQQDFEFDHQLMLLEDHYLQQRSLQVPVLLPPSPPPPFDANYWAYDPLYNSVVEYSPTLSLAQPNSINYHEMFTQTIENNLFLGGGVDHFNSWNEFPLLCEDPYLSHEIIPCIFQNPKPLSPPFIDNQNDFFTNNTTNFNDYYFVNNNNNDQGSTNMEPVQSDVLLEDGNNNNNVTTTRETKQSVKVPKVETIRYEDIRKYFDMPISMAAKALDVGLTVLKKRCRELNIKRWPHRKIKSLESLISNLKELGMADMVEVLEEHKRKLQYVPGLELSTETKKLRQACFKANYKKRRQAALTLTH